MAIQRLPDAELMIMNIVWREDGETTSARVTKMLEGQKEWTATTILTFLSRLVERGFLTVRKEGRQNFYSAAVEEALYVKSESKSFLERLHGNSLTSLVAALYDGQAVSKEDLAELKAYIDGR
ncbi:MAG: BlaI/MecI/CopY family transcriptional regulator [Defluviitaleaceae bacterium]|nr:BlaI/MecI/CopY family transcriptional regulator [Defluviitaleaceae bacterium]